MFPKAFLTKLKLKNYVVKTVSTVLKPSAAFATVFFAFS